MSSKVNYRRIIVLYDYFFPAYKAGGPTASIHTLITTCHDLKFTIYCSNEDEDGSLLNVPSNVRVPYKNSDVFYLSRSFISRSKIAELLNEQNSPVLFINGIYSWYFNIIPLLFRTSARKIVSVRGMLHPGALSQKHLKKKLYLAAWKLAGLHRKCEFHATNEEEKKNIEQVFGKKVKTWVASNFPNILSYQQVSEKPIGSVIIVSMALISPMKNILLVLEALKHCKSNVQYLIYGPVKDSNYWEQCKISIKKMPSNVKVAFKGDVTPTDVPGELANGHVFILPSKSENFGHALYEAMSAGKPVITSHFTPWNYLKDSKAGLNVSVENPAEITTAIEFFASMDYHELCEWSRSARAYALKAIDTEQIKQQYLEMFGVVK